MEQTFAITNDTAEPAAEPPQAKVSVQELIELCALDNELFCTTFFPRTTRQRTPLFHNQIWDLLESTSRLVNIQVFRGGGKTSLLRMYTAKRIAYGLAHTILYISKSESQAVTSVKWLRRAVEFNKLFQSVFNLRPGKKWQDTEAEIWQGTDNYPVWIMAAGITGSIRGINQDDFRPDLIIIDDALNEENCATAEQRQKISALIYGALAQSLAPASEAPDAKLVMLQTPLDREDASTLALSDQEWQSKVFPCWTADTADAPLRLQRSIWPDRWSDATLREKKQFFLDRNQLSIWLREMECRLVSKESSAFDPKWLCYYELLPDRAALDVVMSIDPVPPPSDRQIAKGMKGKDYEAFAVVGRHRGDFYLLDYSVRRGHDPEWTVMEFFQLALRWRPRRIFVETVAYQQTLLWLLRKAMNHQRQYFVVSEFRDRRKKYDRIIDGLSGPAATGHLYVKRDHADFISQFNSYPEVSHDDLIEAVAIAVSELSKRPAVDLDGDLNMSVMLQERDIPALAPVRAAP